MEKTTLFISYSHKNQDLLEELLIHLKPLIGEEKLILWTDRELRAGQKWDQEIKQALEDCHIGVMLISPTFLASDYISKIEIPILLNRAENAQIKLTSLYLLDSVVSKIDFTVKANGEDRCLRLTDYQGLNTPDSPIAKLQDNERAQALKKAAMQLNEIWNSVNQSNSSRPNPRSSTGHDSGRKELTVALGKTAKHLYQNFYRGDEPIAEGKLGIRDLPEVFDQPNGQPEISPPSEISGDQLFQALFGGLGEQACRELLKTVWELDNANSNPSYDSLRLKIYSEDAMLIQLPWPKCTWMKQKLIDCGWSFELIAFHPARTLPGPDFSIKTPLAIRLIVPDSDSLSLKPLGHYESLANGLNRIWSERHYNKPHRCSHWQNDCANQAAVEAIVYFYGCASMRQNQITLKFPDQSVDWPTFKKSLAAHSSPRIVFLNLCSERPDRIARSMREFNADPGLVIVQTFEPDQAIQAQSAALDWFNAVLAEGADPVQAINRYGMDRATAWANYNRWDALITPDTKPVRTELAKLLLDRHRQRETISKTAQDALRSLRIRVIATVASGESSDWLDWFHQQIFTTLRTDLKAHHATVNHTELRFPADANSLDDFQESLYRAFNQSPHRKLGSLFDEKLAKLRTDQTLFWILHWQTQGASLGREFGLNRFRLWEQFCREQLAAECPERLRILCLLPLETEYSHKVKELVTKRPQDFGNRAYRFFDLDPLSRVEELDLGVFLQGLEIQFPDGVLNSLPGLIFQHSAGQFDKSVQLLEEGLSRGFGFLHDKLADSAPESQTEASTDPNEEITL